MKTWAIGVVGYLLGAISAPIWDFAGEQILERFFPKSEPVLQFRVDSHQRDTGIRLRVANSGEKPATIEALTIELCLDDVRLHDRWSTRNRPRPKSLEALDDDSQRQLSGEGDHRWLPRCGGKRITVKPVDRFEVQPGSSSVTFEAVPGFTVTEVVGTRSAVGYECTLVLEYGESLHSYIHQVSTISTCDWNRET